MPAVCLQSHQGKTNTHSRDKRQVCVKKSTEMVLRSTFVTPVYIYICTYIYICMYVCIYIYVCMYIYMYHQISYIIYHHNIPQSAWYQYYAQIHLVALWFSAAMCSIQNNFHQDMQTRRPVSGPCQCQESLFKREPQLCGLNCWCIQLPQACWRRTCSPPPQESSHSSGHPLSFQTSQDDPQATKIDSASSAIPPCRWCGVTPWCSFSPSRPTPLEGSTLELGAGQLIVVVMADQTVDVDLSDISSFRVWPCSSNPCRRIRR